MRTVLGWAVALVAGAFMGAAVYQAVLSDPLPRKAAAEVVPSAQVTPEPAPTLYRTEVREIVDPAPTITVVEEIVVTETAEPSPTAQVRTTTATKAQPQKSSSRRDDDSGKDSRRDDDSGKKAESHDRDDDDYDEAEEREDREDPKDDHAEEDRSEDRHPEAEDEDEDD